MGVDKYVCVSPRGLNGMTRLIIGGKAARKRFLNTFEKCRGDGVVSLFAEITHKRSNALDIAIREVVE